LVDPIPGKFEIVFIVDGSAVGRTSIQVSDLAVVEVRCVHNVKTSGAVEQRSVQVEVTPGEASIPLPVWLRDASAGVKDEEGA
jgi:hypothetical protein